MRLHIALWLGKEIASSQGSDYRYHGSLYICADTNYDGYISVAELSALYEKQYNLESKVIVRHMETLQMFKDRLDFKEFV